MTRSSTRIIPHQPNSLVVDTIPGPGAPRVFALNLIQNENESELLIHGVARNAKVERYGG